MLNKRLSLASFKSVSRASSTRHQPRPWKTGDPGQRCSSKAFGVWSFHTFARSRSLAPFSRFVHDPSHQDALGKQGHPWRAGLIWKALHPLSLLSTEASFSSLEMNSPHFLTHCFLRHSNCQSTPFRWLNYSIAYICIYAFQTMFIEELLSILAETGLHSEKSIEDCNCSLLDASCGGLKVALGCKRRRCVIGECTWRLLDAL